MRSIYPLRLLFSELGSVLSAIHFWTLDFLRELFRAKPYLTLTDFETFYHLRQANNLPFHHANIFYCSQHSSKLTIKSLLRTLGGPHLYNKYTKLKSVCISLLMDFKIINQSVLLIILILIVTYLSPKNVLIGLLLLPMYQLI